MVSLLIGEWDRCEMFKDRYVFLPQHLFDAMYTGDWITDNFSHKVIWEIDKSRVVCESIIQSPIYGSIPPTQLSTGCKSLILMNQMDIVISGERLGDNCWKLLFDLGKVKDITVCLNHMLPKNSLYDFIEFYSLNDNKMWSGDYLDFFAYCLDMFCETRVCRRYFPYG